MIDADEGNGGDIQPSHGIVDDSFGSAPTEPTELGFDGFVGALLPRPPEIRRSNGAYEDASPDCARPHRNGTVKTGVAKHHGVSSSNTSTLGDVGLKRVSTSRPPSAEKTPCMMTCV
jgi:hypothetical protein